MTIGFTLKQKDLAREGRGKFSSESHPIESRRVSAPSQFPVPDGVVISARANLELPRRRARFPRGKPFREPSRVVIERHIDLHFAKKFTITVEHLNSAVAAVANVDISLRIGGNGMGGIEL